MVEAIEVEKPLLKNEMKCCAYVGIHTVSAHEVHVLKKVRKIKGVTEAFRVYGMYDIIAKLETDSRKDLKKVVAEEINEIDKVRGTSTMFLKSKRLLFELTGVQMPSPLIIAASN